ncbi:HotDog domain-containing protein [Cunninghamella echinulata]|nr:HotDog domain-containing protein [Cunninghamella echinulata]
MYESRVTMTEIVTSSHVNVLGVAFAGTILGWIDIAAGIAAKRHASVPCVTRSVDDVAFLRPVKEGDILKIQASVNKSWKTSMEVGVKIEAESPLTAERIFVAHAYLTFVALSPRPKPRTYLGKHYLQYQPIAVPSIVPMNDDEKRRFDMAERRRQGRLKRKQPDYTIIRNTMQAYAQGLQLHQLQDAPLHSHPAFTTKTMISSSSSVEEEKNKNESDEGNPFADSHHQQMESNIKSPLSSTFQQRRYSMDPSMLQPFKSLNTEDSFAEVVKLVMPQHANTLGITFGGQIISWMELCALSSANRLAKAYLLTASIDTLNFITPTRIGDVITIRSIISKNYTSSMEVYVSVEAENLQTGETSFTNDGFFTITAVDKELIPVITPHIIPQTQAEIDLYEKGDERRNKRLLYRQQLAELINSNH